jgi:phytoene synthase
VSRFGLSRKPLEDVLKGVERDLRPVRFKTFGELLHYALQVAGAPGVASMEIFGFKDSAHRRYAENLGIFLQLVNMLRDFKEDGAAGRQYFPTEDFKRFRLDPSSVEAGDPNWARFVGFQLERAKSFLEKSRASLSPGERRLLPTAEAIAAVYLRLFAKLRKNPDRILKEKTSLAKWEKLWAVGATLLRLKLGRG